MAKFSHNTVSSGQCQTWIIFKKLKFFGLILLLLDYDFNSLHDARSLLSNGPTMDPDPQHYKDRGHNCGQYPGGGKGERDIFTLLWH
jgi:hypothetical protein